MTNLNKAISVLKKGGIVIFPTDTAYGIGCRMDDEKAVKRLFEIRSRPSSQATPVLVSSVKMACKCFSTPLPDVVRHLMEKYWPGALTIVYESNNRIPLPVRGGGRTVGLRMPNHKTILKVIKRLDIPVLGPSANLHGQPTPFRYEDLDPNLVKQADYVISGKCQEGNVSTVVDCTSEPFKIIRQGAIMISDL